MYNIKRIVILVISALCTFFAVSAYEYSTQDKIVVCGGESGLVFVVKQRYDYTVYPSKNLKDTLNCIGKSVPFYKREIILESNKAPNKKQLEERYKVKITNDKKGDVNIDKVKDGIYSITSVNKKTVLIFAKDFKLSKNTLDIIEKLKPVQVFLSDNDELVQKNTVERYLIVDPDVKVYMLQIGSVREVLL